MTPQVFPALEKQGAGAAGPVADLVLLLRLDDFRHEVGNFSRRVELAGTFARLAGEGADQILVGVAKEVIRDVGAIELAAGEVVFEVDQLVAWQLVGLVEINLAGEDAIELRRIGPLNGEHGVIERLAELERRDFLFRSSNGDSLPGAIQWHEERQ